MRALLVAARPLPGSLNAYLADQAETAARDAGHAVKRLDLYAANFDPRLGADERRSYYGTAPVVPGRTA